MFAVSKNNPHRGGMLTCAHMLPPSSQRKSSQKRDFDLGSHASHHLKNNPPKGRIPKRWDKNLVQEILLIEGYLHVSTFYSVMDESEDGDPYCNDQFRQRWESPQVPAALSSALGLAPQSLGLLGGLRDGTGVS